MTSTNRQVASNILLVHGGTDGSIWTPVIQWLQFQRFNVVASQMPLTSFEQDVRAVERDLGALEAPTVVVGHTYGGLVITQATSGKPNVASLVYIAGCALDTDETIFGILKKRPTPALEFVKPIDAEEKPNRFALCSATRSPSSPVQTFLDPTPMRSPQLRLPYQKPAFLRRLQRHPLGGSSRPGT